MKRLVVLLVAAVVLLFLAAPLGAAEPLMVGWALAAGWYAYVAREFPAIELSWPGLVLAALCVVGSVVLGHWLIRWLWESDAPADNGSVASWRLRSTLKGFGIILLAFVCGIAATGVTHQTGWLLASPESLFRRTNRPEVECSHRLRYLGSLMTLYALEHDGKFPDRLEQLEEIEGFRAELLRCPSPAGHAYIYYGAGARLAEGDAAREASHRPVICEPLSNHRTSVRILYADLQRVGWHKPGEAYEIMQTVPLSP